MRRATFSRAGAAAAARSQPLLAPHALDACSSVRLPPRSTLSAALALAATRWTRPFRPRLASSNPTTSTRHDVTLDAVSSRAAAPRALGHAPTLRARLPGPRHGPGRGELLPLSPPSPQARPRADSPPPAGATSMQRHVWRRWSTGPVHRRCVLLLAGPAAAPRADGRISLPLSRNRAVLFSPSSRGQLALAFFEWDDAQWLGVGADAQGGKNDWSADVRSRSLSLSSLVLASTAS